MTKARLEKKKREGQTRQRDVERDVKRDVQRDVRRDVNAPTPSPTPTSKPTPTSTPTHNPEGGVGGRVSSTSEEIESAWRHCAQLAKSQAGLHSPGAFIASKRKKYTHPRQANISWWQEPGTPPPETRETLIKEIRADHIGRKVGTSTVVSEGLDGPKGFHQWAMIPTDALRRIVRKDPEPEEPHELPHPTEVAAFDGAPLDDGISDGSRRLRT